MLVILNLQTRVCINFVTPRIVQLEFVEKPGRLGPARGRDLGPKIPIGFRLFIWLKIVDPRPQKCL